MYILGVINSRRLGKSLGIDITGIDRKRCNMNCIYCECGHGEVVSEKNHYADIDEAIKELKLHLDQDVDVITFSGLGEPTLNIDLGYCIDRIKGITDIPVCVLTNSGLLEDIDTFNALLKADIVIPSVDAVFEDEFQRINNPHASLNLETILESVRRFSDEFEGELYVEIFLIKGVNDSLKHLDALKDYLSTLKYDMLQLNTVDRTPAEDISLYSDAEKKELLKYFSSFKNVRIY